MAQIGYHIGEGDENIGIGDFDVLVLQTNGIEHTGIATISQVKGLRVVFPVTNLKGTAALDRISTAANRPRMIGPSMTHENARQFEVIQCHDIPICVEVFTCKMTI